MSNPMFTKRFIDDLAKYQTCQISKYPIISIFESSIITLHYLIMLSYSPNYHNEALQLDVNPSYEQHVLKLDYPFYFLEIRQIREVVCWR